MKLAKKMLACVVALVLMGSFAVMAFAADPFEVLVAAKGEAVVGETVVVAVSVDKAKGLAAINFDMAYDATVLEFVSVKKAEGAKFDLFSGGVPITGSSAQLTGGALLEGALDTDSSPMAEYTFKVLKAGDAKLALAVTSTKDAADAEMTSVVKVTALTAKEVAETTTKAPTETTTGKGNTEIPKTGEAGLAVAAGLVVLAGAAFVVSKKKK